MRLQHLWLKQFRSYPAATLDCPSGLCVLWGPNGVGKSNVLEAIAYLSTLRSFRSAPAEALIADGDDAAVVRADVVDHDRSVLIEAEITRNGPNRVQLNRQRVQRGSSLREVLRVTVFSPDDLELLKGGPGVRRELVDEAAIAIRPRNDEVRADWERVLRQRNALLKQVAGRLDDSARLTLEVWDTKAAESGSRLLAVRTALVERLAPAVQQAYRDLAGAEDRVELRYVASWTGELHDALVAARADELRRSLTLVGPHRDELRIELNGMPARTHASQGEQRCLALALRLATHREVQHELGSPPVLLLDDVFSELDPRRSAALVAALPAGQTFLSTASPLPAGVRPDAVVHVGPGTLEPGALHEASTLDLTSREGAEEQDGVRGSL